MKLSEARIILYLNQVRTRESTIKLMAYKLKIDFSYVCKIIDDMIERKWIKKMKFPVYTYHKLYSRAPTKEAVKVLQLEYKNKKQRRLK